MSAKQWPYEGSSLLQLAAQAHPPTAYLRLQANMQGCSSIQPTVETPLSLSAYPMQGFRVTITVGQGSPVQTARPSQGRSNIRLPIETTACQHIQHKITQDSYGNIKP
eukprot:1157578-Pelagomonas_calceolata.AAC.9